MVLMTKLKQKMEMKPQACYGIAFLALVSLVAEGWAQDTSCLNQLAPCLNYLNGTQDPPNSCCNPLKSVIKSNPECLCSMISINGSNLAEQAGIDVNEAQQLPARCGQHVNPISCLSNSPSSKDSRPSSASICSVPSRGILLAAALSTASHILWALSSIMT